MLTYPKVQFRITRTVNPLSQLYVYIYISQKFQKDPLVFSIATERLF